MCLFRVTETKLNIYTLLPPKTPIRAQFRWNLEIFAQNRFNIGYAHYKRPLNVIVTP